MKTVYHTRMPWKQVVSPCCFRVIALIDGRFSVPSKRHPLAFVRRFMDPFDQRRGDLRRDDLHGSILIEFQL